jgi:hypothetical protein
MSVKLLGVRFFDPENPKAFFCCVADVPWPFCRNAPEDSPMHFGINDRHSLDLLRVDPGYPSMGVNIVRIVGEFDPKATSEPLIEESFGPGTLYR